MNLVEEFRLGYSREASRRGQIRRLRRKVLEYPPLLSVGTGQSISIIRPRHHTRRWLNLRSPK